MIYNVLASSALPTCHKPSETLMDEFDDTPEYLAGWAAKLVEALAADELRLLARDYGRLARNPKLSARDRAIARRREKAIRSKL